MDSSHVEYTLPNRDNPNQLVLDGKAPRDAQGKVGLALKILLFESIQKKEEIIKEKQKFETIKNELVPEDRRNWVTASKAKGNEVKRVEQLLNHFDLGKPDELIREADQRATLCEETLQYFSDEEVPTGIATLIGRDVVEETKRQALFWRDVANNALMVNNSLALPLSKTD